MVLNQLLSREEEQRGIAGVVTGIVTNNHDPEKRGRVKVSLPWMDEKDESDWARIASPMAGNGSGMVFLPEVGDEVVVVFEQGDINYPYVIGSLWNGKDLPPESNSDGKNNIRKIKSRSGHELTFNDTEQQEKLEIRTNGGHMIIMEDSVGGEKIEIADKNGSNKITINSVENSISMESATQLSIKAQTIEIEAGGTMTIKSSGVLTLQGSLVKIN